MRHRLALLSAVLALLTAAPAFATLPESTAVPSLAPILREVTPGVVNIATQSRERVDNPLLRDPFFRQFFGIPNQPLEREVRASGSGVIVDAARGFVLTNNHVVEGANLIEVTTKDNRRFRARLVGRDPGTDVAVLKIDATDLAEVPFGDSDKLEVGDYVLAIGNPFGLGQTVTSGIVSALGRSGLGIEGYEDFIQTDASINPGNSGGALIDLRGRLIGINTAILAPNGGNVGVGFAVPINMARQVMDELVSHGTIKRGRIGIGVQDVTPELGQSAGIARSEGAIITQVEPRSPAAQAGIRPGDIVVAFNGLPIRSSTQLRNRIGLTRVDEQVELTLERNGSQRAVRVRIEPGREIAGDAAGEGRR